ncbi:hypothetical protein OIU35_28615 [Boseaceae bacterium BT-24-1]|nr:hypothetical protein [Boseaceae bacterium BT-24-1]
MRRLRNREDAADATQETFVRLLDIAPRTVIENPQAYLFRGDQRVVDIGQAPADGGERKDDQRRPCPEIERQAEPDAPGKADGDQNGQTQTERCPG